MGVGRRLFLGLALPVALASSALSHQPVDPGINLDPPIECWYTDEFPLIGAEIPNRGALDLSLRPPSFRSLRLYYRCEQYADYYYIDFESTSETAFEAVAPMAEESCTGVYYYVEGITPEYASTRTPERRVDVTTSDACRDRYPAVAWWLGSDAPEIVVRSAAAATPVLPLGFKADGIRMESGGRGIGSGTAIALGAGAAAGLGVLAAAGGGEDNTSTTTTTTPQASTSTSAPATTTSSPATTSSPTTTSSATTTSSTTTTSTSTSTSSSTTSTSTSTSTSSTTSTTTSTVPLSADVAASVAGPSMPVIVQNNRNFQVNISVTNNGPDAASNVEMVYDASIDGSADIDYAVSAGPSPSGTTCSAQPRSTGRAPYRLTCTTNTLAPGAGYTIRVDWSAVRFTCCGIDTVTHDVSVSAATQDPAASNNTDSAATTVESTLILRTDATHERPGMAFRSHLELDTRSPVRGRVVINDTEVQETLNHVPFQHRARGSFGRNSIEAHLVSNPDRDGRWRFDFTDAPHFVPGSLRVELGQAISVEPSSVVFDVTSTGEERVRFVFELAR